MTKKKRRGVIMIKWETQGREWDSTWGVGVQGKEEKESGVLPSDGMLFSKMICFCVTDRGACCFLS
ncbi:hypothetical protein Prudu_018703 [Prunus dulcis]|uniref:Uncharacterized protein n=1 Tax=Prunus dulcis TaxID=3755 RepID=A0A4Y1RRK3_PRUDU|nr:hypothetical protein Prudu_018703 [Prunus dulcis]